MSPRDNAEMIAEEELVGLFERRRPDADSFRAGIEERIAELEEEREGSAADSVRAPNQKTFLRRVAAVLPIDPFSGALAGSGLGKAFGGKLVPGILALPALVLAAAFGGFVVGARALRRTSAGAEPVDRATRGSRWKHGSPAQRAMGKKGALFNLIQFGALGGFVAAWLFGGSFAIDVLMLVLVLSMLALVWTVADLKKAGLLSRPDITRVAVGILLAVFMGCFLWFHNIRIADDASDLGIGWSSGVILGGIVLSLLCGGAWLKSLVALVISAAAMFVLNIPGQTHSSPASLRDQLEAMALSTDDLGRWRDAAAIYTALEAVGERQPDLSDLRQQVSLAMRSGSDEHPVVWTSAHRMDLIASDDWRALSTRKLEAYHLDQLMRAGGQLNKTTYQQYVLPMLLASREIDAGGREALAQKVLATWPTTGEHGALERALACVLALDELKRPDLVASLREPALALLSDHWVSGEGTSLFASVGGFTPNPETFQTSIDDDTLHGVELMARFGVPERVDLYLLRSYLRRACYSQPLIGAGHAYLKAIERASLLRLEEQIGLPARTWFESLLAERLLLASILIVLLCLIAIRLAPPLVDPIEVTATGAQP